jgi:hypothetical protein
VCNGKSADTPRSRWCDARKYLTDLSDTVRGTFINALNIT